MRAIGACALVALCLLACCSAVARAAGRDAPAEAPADRVTTPTRTGGGWIAKLLTPTPVRARAGGRGRVVWRARTATAHSGAPVRLLVLGERTLAGRRWLRVRLPLRPNSAAGWLPRDRVSLVHRDLSIRIRLRARTLTAWRNGHVLRRARVVIGTAATPTPTGLFAIYEKVAQTDPGAFLGPWALHLTAHSDVLDDYGGGPGRVAIHGRGGASLADPLGSARSHGCVRIDNDVVSWLAARAPTGTPVWITR